MEVQAERAARAERAAALVELVALVEAAVVEAARVEAVMVVVMVVMVRPAARDVATAAGRAVLEEREAAMEAVVAKVKMAVGRVAR